MSAKPKRDRTVSDAFRFAKSVIQAIRNGENPPLIPEHFGLEKARLCRVALWQYACKAGIPMSAMSPEIRDLITTAKEGEEWKNK